jgi:hypothetical protein
VGTVAPIPDGIAILIDILAHEALKTLMAERAELRSAVTRDRRRLSHSNSARTSLAKSADARLNRAKAGHSKMAGVIKTKSCPQQDLRQTDLVQKNQIDTKIKSILLVAGGGFDLCITHSLALPIVPASLTHCPR